MLVRLLVEVDKDSVFPYYWLEKEKTIFFDIKCHDSYLTKCLHNNITQNDTIWWHQTYHILFRTLKLHLTNVTLNM